MRKRKETEITQNNLCVDIKGLQTLLCSGRATAEKIGTESRAAFKVGHKKLYKIDRINAYLDSLADKE